MNEILIHTGYQNLNNFYKYFKEFTGETPAAYVQNLINKRG
ncbi:hypothetical protein [Acetobacterium sp.]